MNVEKLTATAPFNVAAKPDSLEERLLGDYYIALVSREVSLLGRKDVLSGKGKFGIFGDGKEIAQVALAHYILPGDFRSGYYRDQTLMFALGICSISQFFSQMYADSDHDPFSGGRQMNCHFATPFIDKNGNWTIHRDQYNVISDISSVAGQVGRALGLAQASLIYKKNKLLDQGGFSSDGNEITFCTIGDASTSEGAFWETMNAAAVMQVPLVMIVWDDGYGISVPIEYQTVKSSISRALEGFIGEKEGEGIQIFTAKGWDYPELCKVFEKATTITRKYSTPVLVHVQEMTQPQGHSTSGSQERYKSKDRMEWERHHDNISVMSNWLKEIGVLQPEEDDLLRKRAKEWVKKERDISFEQSLNKAKSEVKQLIHIYQELAHRQPDWNELIQHQVIELSHLREPVISDLVRNVRRFLIALPSGTDPSLVHTLKSWNTHQYGIVQTRFHAHQTSETQYAALKVRPIPATYSDGAPMISGYKILNQYFDRLFSRDPRVYAFGQDVGKIGDVNQGFAGLQAKYGEQRIFDTGIREWTIVGQAIGMAMRGLKPIAEIQYIDYLIYCLSPLSDDVASMRYRSNGIQCAPIIIRSRGHRLEGIWHSGSPMGMILNAIRGIYLLVPRNMVQAAGFYQTMLQSDDPAIIIECLNGYRLKERLPDNLGTFCLPLGEVEVLRQGTDITVVTYGSCVRIAEQAIDMVSPHGISVELIDVQSLLPFDLNHSICASLKKTNKVVFLDEDVPGGATAYMMREVLDTQGAYHYLDAAPVCISSAAHRPPYGSDGDYFSKPNAEDVAEKILEIVRTL
jgi:pyruvate/2-oxoglutarate/acetoin dehydrogenase E1 component/TPP-dependent pyruvate/acetoin dehydrogenase alpha subunit